jgi:TRAP-type C4-dicarboxylate transport system permease small subunit
VRVFDDGSHAHAGWRFVRAPQDRAHHAAYVFELEASGAPMSYFTWFLRLLALASGVVLLAMMAMTTVDVILRYIFNSPLEGSREMTQFAMVLIVFLAMAYCGLTGGHIAVDLFEKALDRPSLRLLPALIAWAGAAVFVVITWRTLVEAFATSSKVTNMMFIPYFPFMLVTAFGSAMFALVLMVQGWQALNRSYE